jgi:hypothetical protein
MLKITVSIDENNVEKNWNIELADEIILFCK